MKFANKFPESLPCADSVDFSFICLLFRAKCIAEVNRAFVKSRHFTKFSSTDRLFAACFFPGRIKFGGKTLPALHVIG